jgi:AraC family transcriptional activator of pobA
MDSIPVRQIQTITKEPVFAESFSVRDIATLLTTGDMIQELHRHNFFYVLVIKKGTGKHEIDFNPYTVRDFSIFFMRPGQVHQLTLHAGSTGYLIQFKEAFNAHRTQTAHQLIRRASACNHYQLNADSFRKLLPVLTYSFREYNNMQDGYPEIIQANMEIFFIELIRLQSNPPADHTHLYMQEQLETFLELLETHFTGNKQVSRYAAMLNRSTYQLNAITKATLGKTCSELINEYIILEAKRQLLATTDQVNQIADYLGYEDISYFIRFFKKHTGQSPELFRHNFK